MVRFLLRSSIRFWVAEIFITERSRSASLQLAPLSRLKAQDFVSFLWVFFFPVQLRRPCPQKSSSQVKLCFSPTCTSVPIEGTGFHLFFFFFSFFPSLSKRQEEELLHQQRHKDQLIMPQQHPNRPPPYVSTVLVKPANDHYGLVWPDII